MQYAKFSKVFDSLKDYKHLSWDESNHSLSLCDGYTYVSITYSPEDNNFHIEWKEPDVIVYEIVTSVEEMIVYIISALRYMEYLF